MSLTFTDLATDVQTQLSAIHTAQQAGNWATVWSTYGAYCLAWSGWATKATADGKSYEYPTPAMLREALEQAQIAATRAGDQRRLIKTRTSHV